ncbi:MAG: universal stress protein [Micrococcales bacterium]|nr:universal stress protein [Micrococcales bacterium]
MSESETTPIPYTVVVGVSQTSKSPRALEWAKAQADAENGRVIAVRAWRPQVPQATPSGESAGRINTAAAIEKSSQEQLAADVESVLGPDHGVELRLVRGGRRKVLLEAAKEADLLVVDAPRSVVAGPMFGHRLVYAATCPVVVMPPAISGEPPTAMARAAGAVGRAAVKSAGTAGRPGYRPPLRHDG